METPEEMRAGRITSGLIHHMACRSGLGEGPETLARHATWYLSEYDANGGINVMSNDDTLLELDCQVNCGETKLETSVTIPCNGRVEDNERAMLTAASSAMQTGIEHALPGTPLSEITQTMEDAVSDAGFDISSTVIASVQDSVGGERTSDQSATLQEGDLLVLEPVICDETDTVVHLEATVTVADKPVVINPWWNYLPPLVRAFYAPLYQ